MARDVQYSLPKSSKLFMLSNRVIVLFVSLLLIILLMFLFEIESYAAFLYVLCSKSVRYDAAIITSLSNKSSPK